LSKLGALLGIFLGNFNFIWANSHLHTEIGITHGVAHKSWVDVDWNTFLLAESLLGSSSGGGLLLLKLNLIWTNEHMQIKLGISHGILHDNWVDMNWDSLSKSSLLILLLHLSELESDWCWMIGDEILEGSNGYIVVEKREIVLLGLLLSKLESDWCWVVGDEILESGNGYVVVEKSEVVLLSKLESNWCWVVGDEVLEGSNGHVVVEKREIVLLSKLEGNWCWVVGDEVLEGSN